MNNMDFIAEEIADAMMSGFTEAEKLLFEEKKKENKHKQFSAKIKLHHPFQTLFKQKTVQPQMTFNSLLGQPIQNSNFNHDLLFSQPMPMKMIVFQKRNNLKRNEPSSPAAATLMDEMDKQFQSFFDIGNQHLNHQHSFHSPGDAQILNTIIPLQNRQNVQFKQSFHIPVINNSSRSFQSQRVKQPYINLNHQRINQSQHPSGKHQNKTTNIHTAIQNHHQTAANNHQTAAPNIHQTGAQNNHQTATANTTAQNNHQTATPNTHQSTAQNNHQPATPNSHQPATPNSHQPTTPNSHHPTAQNNHQQATPNSHQQSQNTTVFGIKTCPLQNINWLNFGLIFFFICLACFAIYKIFTYMINKDEDSNQKNFSINQIEDELKGMKDKNKLF